MPFGYCKAVRALGFAFRSRTFEGQKRFGHRAEILTQWHRSAPSRPDWDRAVINAALRPDTRGTLEQPAYWLTANSLTRLRHGAARNELDSELGRARSSLLTTSSIVRALNIPVPSEALLETHRLRSKPSHRLKRSGVPLVRPLSTIGQQGRV